MIYHPVCASLNGQLIDYDNEFEADCEYVYVSLYVILSVRLCFTLLNWRTTNLKKKNHFTYKTRSLCVCFFTYSVRQKVASGVFSSFSSGQKTFNARVTSLN